MHDHEDIISKPQETKEELPFFSLLGTHEKPFGNPNCYQELYIIRFKPHSKTFKLR